MIRFILFEIPSTPMFHHQSWLFLQTALGITGARFFFYGRRALSFCPTNNIKALMDVTFHTMQTQIGDKL